MKDVDRVYKNVFSVDVEDWYHSTDLKIDCNDWHKCESRIVDSTNILLNLLEETNVKGVFFILSDVALRHPELVRRIKEAGHEIGSHGCTHKMVSDMAPEEFLCDLRKSREVLEDITGDRIYYYRAPVWSISRRNLWALELLDQEGFLCDSSIQPIRTSLSGDRKCPLSPFRPIVNRKRLSIVEFPSTVWTLGFLRLAFAGGLFLRMMPKCIIEKGLHHVNLKRYGMVYVHPWEVDIHQPRVYEPRYAAITHYGNLRTTRPKLKMLLEKFQFVTMMEFLESETIPETIISPKEQGSHYER